MLNFNNNKIMLGELLMPNIKIRISEEERNMIKDYSEFFGKSMATCIRDAFFKEYYKHSNRIQNYINAKNECS